ncbi:MAG: rane dipeptidase [Thermomicrobiales bacterium]|nr:rane dipeptidase [Thermomicrobiales bacterium]
MVDEARRIHEDSIIIDGLFCKMNVPIPPTEQAPGLLLEHIKQSGVTAFCDSVIADSYPESAEGALMKLHAANLMGDVFPDEILIIRTVEDLRTAKREGKIGIILTTQGLASIGTNTRYIWVYRELGVRVMQLTYNEHNALGSGCREPNDQGLTRFGQQVIEQMNGLGVVVDLSHVGRRTSLDAIAYTKQPPIFSHSGVLAFNPHPRNLSDEQIKLTAEKGGVLGMCPHSVFIERERGKRPTVDEFIDNIKYVADLTGIDHVGIGTDNFQYDSFYCQLGRAEFERTFPSFFGGYKPEEKHAEGFGCWAEWPNLTAQLLRRGFGADDVAKVLGGNFLRVFEQVWQ